MTESASQGEATGGSPPTGQSPRTAREDLNYQRALRSVELTLEKLTRCSEAEKASLRQELQDLRQMADKLTQGRVEIVIFGEISTGKSALINALAGAALAEVDVRGGWTKDVWHVPWEGSGYCIHGLADSMVVLVDTPGLNEVGGEDRARMAREAAARADLVLFVTDSDLNESEYQSLLQLSGLHKPVIVVLNKVDLYSPEQRRRLEEVLRGERLPGLVPPDQLVLTQADPREREYVIEAADGSTRSEWRKPSVDVESLKLKILELLDREGLALLALNAAMYAADKSDRIATLRVQFREKRANQVIWSYAAVKAIAVGVNPMPAADVLAGGAVDVSMVVTLAHIYGLDMSWKHARRLVTSILTYAGWVGAVGVAGAWAGSLFKALTAGLGTALTAVPQGAVAGYGSIIVGKAAKHFFEHGSSWGSQGPKVVVRQILNDTDRESVIQGLSDEIRKKLSLNVHSDPGGS